MFQEDGDEVYSVAVHPEKGMHAVPTISTAPISYLQTKQTSSSYRPDSSGILGDGSSKCFQVA